MTEKKTSSKKTVVKKKASAVKKPAVKKTAIKKPVSESKNRAKPRKKTNLSKLCTEMNKVAHDAVDREIIKRFKIMIDTCEEDITKTSLTAVVKEPTGIDLSSFHESLQPYIKHYLFMLKRSKSK